MKPQRLLFLLESDAIGGTETVLRGLFRELRRHPFCIYLATHSPKTREFLCSEVDGCFESGRSVSEWERLLVTHRITQAIGVYGNVPALFAACAKRSIPRIYFCSQGSQGSIKFQKERELVMALSSVATVPSRYLFSDFQPTKAVLIPFGVDTRQFQPLKALDRLGLRGVSGIPRGAFVLGYSARFTPKKEHQVLFAVLKRLGTVQPNIHLLLMGPKPTGNNKRYLQSLKQQVRILGLSNRITFLDASYDDMPRVLSLLDCFVFPALEEGFGMALLEAMSMALPVVVRGGSGSSELVRKGGVILPASDTEELCHAIVALVKAPTLRKRLGLEARREAVGHFSIQRMGKSYCKLFEGIRQW